MKFFLLIVCLFSLSAQAELIQKNDRDIYDLMWLPTRRTLFAASEVHFRDSKVKQEVDGNEVAELQVQQHEFSQMAGFSLTDWLALNAQMKYLFKRENTERPFSGPSEISRDKGPSDPMFEARVRVLDQARSPFNLDLLPFYLISTGETEAGSNNKEGNYKEGGDVYGLRLEVGKKFITLQWMGFLGYTQNAEAKLRSVGEPDISIEDAYRVLSAGVRIQGFIDQNFLIHGHATYQQEEAHRSKNLTTLDQAKITPVNTAVFGGGLSYIYSSGLMLSGLFELGATDDYTTQQDPGLKIDFKQGTLTNLTLSARYQF